MRLISLLGLDDKDGNLSFNKTVTAIFTAVVAYAILHGIEVGTHLTVLAIAVLAAGFGLKGLSMFFANWKHTTSVNMTGDVAKVAEAVTRQRDHKRGIDPA